MEESKQFKKLTIAGRKILTDYVADGDRQKMIKAVIKNIDSQKCAGLCLLVLQ